MQILFFFLYRCIFMQLSRTSCILLTGSVLIFQEKVGRCVMTLTKVILEGEVQGTFPLDGAKSGKLSLHVKWTAQPVFRDP